jgi:AcrR family transcriptional regulator
MGEQSRPLRADAERNRRALLDAAAEMFREHGLEVGIAEIAQRAGVGRGTVFRRFPTKEHLIAAIVVDRMSLAVAYGRELLQRASEAPGEALFDFLEEITGRHQLDRALFDGLDESWIANDEIRAAQAQFTGLLEQLVSRAQEAGVVREDVGAADVLLLFKGMCEAVRSYSHAGPDVAERQLDLIRAALAPSAQPLRGRAPSLAAPH